MKIAITIGLHALTLFTVVNATSIKMDFLPLGDVRTDPIINPTCLSDHVHTFYGELRTRQHDKLKLFCCIDED